MSNNPLGWGGGSGGRGSFDLQHLPVSGVSADALGAEPRPRKRGAPLADDVSQLQPPTGYVPMTPPRILEALAQDRGERVQGSSRLWDSKHSKLPSCINDILKKLPVGY